MVYQGHVENGVIVLDSPTALPNGAKVEVSVVLRERNRKAIEQLDRWLADDSGYDERVWPELKKALDENRVNSGERRHFDEKRRCLELIQSWAEEDGGYNEEVLSELMPNLNRSRDEVEAKRL